MMSGLAKIFADTININNIPNFIKNETFYSFFAKVDLKNHLV